MPARMVASVSHPSSFLPLIPAKIQTWVFGVELEGSIHNLHPKSISLTAGRGWIDVALTRKSWMLKAFSEVRIEHASLAKMGVWIWSLIRHFYVGGVKVIFVYSGGVKTARRLYCWIIVVEDSILLWLPQLLRAEQVSRNGSVPRHSQDCPRVGSEL